MGYLQNFAQKEIIQVGMVVNSLGTCAYKAEAIDLWQSVEYRLPAAQEGLFCWSVLRRINQDRSIRPPCTKKHFPDQMVDWAGGTGKCVSVMVTTGSTWTDETYSDLGLSP
jgi:hypothetical protein